MQATSFGAPVTIGTVTESGHIRERFPGGTNYLIDMSSSGSANVFSDWYEYWPVTDEVVYLCGITTREMGHTNGIERTVEVGVGPVDSENTIARFVSGQLEVSEVGVLGSLIYTFAIPITIASGSRVATRLSDNQGAQHGLKVGLQFYAGL